MDKEILNLEEAAQLFNVSIKTFIKLLKEEKVPARKIGREWRFSRKALVEWLCAGNSQLYSSSDAETKEFFNKVAPEWGRIREGFSDKVIIDRLYSSGLLHSGSTVLDLGAGDGFITLEAALKVKKVISVDLSAGMLALLQSRAKERRLNNIELIEGEGTNLPLEDRSIDLVCASMFLHHIEDPAVAIEEIYRVLKPSGAVFIADYVLHDDAQFSIRMHDIWQGFTREQLREWFGEKGFMQIKCEIAGKVSGSGKKDILVLTAIKPEN